MDKHLVDFYESSKKMEKNFETNLFDNSDPINLTHHDAFDLLEDRKLSWPVH